MALGDLLGLEHVPVVRERGEEERVLSIPVLLEGRRVYVLSRSCRNTGDSPGAVGPGCAIEESQVAEVFRVKPIRGVGFAFTCSKRQREMGAG